MKTLLLLLAVLSTLTYSQFDSLIFSKEMKLNGSQMDVDGRTIIFPLGDQNNDGFDDIMLYDCRDERGYIYFGGNPMDTIAVNSIRFFDRVNNIVGSIAVIDINDDDIKDIVVTTTVYNDSLFWHSGSIKIYYGGDIIDTIPNLTFNPPPGASSSVPQVLEDFNGDGRSELVIYDANLPFSQKQYGTLYFYSAGSQFDTMPHYILTGDSINKIRIGGIRSSGDINGDGKTDFIMSCSEGEGASYRYSVRFYLGNENYDLEPSVIYYQDEHSFELVYWQIINDINDDGKDDIFIEDYGFYPYYYINAILYGSFPIDTIPDVGLNTQNVTVGLNISLGDVNGDGYNDFISTSGGFGYHNIKLWLGGMNMPGTIDDIANKTWYGTSDGFGRTKGAVGDVDGDSVDDIAIGQIPYGDYLCDNYCCKSRIYIIKGDTSIVTSIKEIESVIPELYIIEEPYPNPFNPATKISYQFPIAAKVVLKIYDLLGREVKTLVNEEKQAGYYEAEFDASDLSSGVYLYRISINDFVKTMKLMVLK